MIQVVQCGNARSCAPTLLPVLIKMVPFKFLAQATSAPSFYALSKASTTTKAGKKPQKRTVSSKSSTKTFAKLREEMNLTESVVPHSPDPMNCASETHSSLPATSMFQCHISLFQSCKSIYESSSVFSSSTGSYHLYLTNHSLGYC